MRPRRAPVHARVPVAAQPVLAGYAHRTSYLRERSKQGERSTSWTDPDTGRMRQVSYRDGGIESEFALVPDGRLSDSLVDGRRTVHLREAVALKARCAHS